MKAAFRYIAVPEEAYRIAGPHRIIPMDLWAMAHGSRLRTVRVTERQWEPEVSRRHARTVLSDLVTAGLLLVAERGDRGSVYRVVDASTGTFGEDVYHSAYHNADHNCPEPTSEPDTNADRIADHARVDPRACPTLPYLTLPSDQGELRVETPSTEVAIVPLAEPAAPAALGPADPASDEPDWGPVLHTIPDVPMTYDDEVSDGEEEAGCVAEAANHAGMEAPREAAKGEPQAQAADAVVDESGGSAGWGLAAPPWEAVQAFGEADGGSRPSEGPEGHHGLWPQHGVLSHDRGAVDPEADSPAVGSLAEDRRDAPPEVAEAVEVDPPRAQPARSLRAAALGSDTPTDAVLTLPLGGATQPPPATRATDVDALWEAWQAHGTVRGKPNAHRKAAMARVLRDYPLADLLEMLDAAHNGDGDKWRFLQGATSRSNAVYLRPENLLRQSTIAGRMDDAHDWVAAGRPKHNAAEARVEARTEAAAASLVNRAKAAWEKTILPNRSSQRRLNEVMAAWGDGPRAEEARRAILGGLGEAKGLTAIGMATDFTRPEKMRAFVRGFVAALGGEVTEAELREVG